MPLPNIYIQRLLPKPHWHWNEHNNNNCKYRSVFYTNNVNLCYYVFPSWSYGRFSQLFALQHLIDTRSFNMFRGSSVSLLLSFGTCCLFFCPVAVKSSFPSDLRYLHSTLNYKVDEPITASSAAEVFSCAVTLWGSSECHNTRRVARYALANEEKFPTESR